MADASACSCARAESSWATAESYAAWDESRSLLAMSSRAKSSVFQIALGVHHGDLRLRRLRLALGVRRAGVLDVCAGTLDLGLLVEDRGLGGSEVGLRLVDLRLEDVGVDARDDLALLHDRVEVDEELFDLPRNLAADLDGDDRVEVAGRRDGSGERTTLDARQPVLGRVPDGLGVEIGPDAGARKNGHRQEWEKPLHHSVRRRRRQRYLPDVSVDPRRDRVEPARCGNRRAPGPRCFAPASAPAGRP